MMRRRLLGLTLLGLFIFPSAAVAGTPLETIQAQVNKVLDVLRDAAVASEDAKKDKIRAIVGGIFDYTELSRRTLGRNWRKLNGEQKREFIDLFRKLLDNVYMDRIIAYTNEKVLFNKQSMLSESKAEVQSEIVTQSQRIPINYRMVLKNGSWKVYDVVVEGVSLIQNYRSQFNEILANKTPEDLLKALRKKVGKA